MGFTDHAAPCNNRDMNEAYEALTHKLARLWNDARIAAAQNKERHDEIEARVVAKLDRSKNKDARMFTRYDMAEFYLAGQYKALQNEEYARQNDLVRQIKAIDPDFDILGHLDNVDAPI